MDCLFFFKSKTKINTILCNRVCVDLNAETDKVLASLVCSFFSVNMLYKIDTSRQNVNKRNDNIFTEGLQILIF